MTINDGITVAMSLIGQHVAYPKDMQKYDDVSLVDLQTAALRGSSNNPHIVVTDNLNCGEELFNEAQSHEVSRLYILHEYNTLMVGDQSMLVPEADVWAMHAERYRKWVEQWLSYACVGCGHM